MPVSTVTEYLAALPADRRQALNEVRRGINRALPPGYEERHPVRRRALERSELTIDTGVAKQIPHLTLGPNFKQQCGLLVDIRDSRIS